MNAFEIIKTVRLTEKAIALGPDDLSLGQELMGNSAYLAGLTGPTGTVLKAVANVMLGRPDDAIKDLARTSSLGRGAS